MHCVSVTSHVHAGKGCLRTFVGGSQGGRGAGQVATCNWTKEVWSDRLVTWQPTCSFLSCTAWFLCVS